MSGSRKNKSMEIDVNDPSISGIVIRSKLRSTRSRLKKNSNLRIQSSLKSDGDASIPKKTDKTTLPTSEVPQVNESLMNGNGDNNEFISEIITYRCNYCSVSLNTRDEVAEHVESAHRTRMSQRSNLECDKCGLSYQSQSQYLSHRDTCMKKSDKEDCEFMKCQLCHEVLLQMEDHFKIKHPDDLEIRTEKTKDVYRCSLCGVRLANLNSWLGHVRNHSVEKSFECLICHSKYPTQNELLRHVSSHPIQRNYACDACPQEFTLPVAKDRHVKSHGRHICKLCPNSYKHKKTLMTHMRRVHDVNESEDENMNDEKADDEEVDTEAADVVDDDKDGNWSDDNKEVAVRTRSRNRRDKSSTVADVVAVSERNAFPCDLCDEIFASTILRRRHFAKDHHGQVSCIPCNLTFSHRRYLRRHRTRCHGPKTSSWVCEVCGKAFNCSYALSTHRRIHFAPKKHACNVCGMRFQRAENMRRHEALHSRSNAFVCDVCGHCFSSKFSLQKHAESHIDDKDKTHLCDLCGVGFSRRNILKWHIQSDCGKKKSRDVMPGVANRGRLPGIPNSGSRQLLPYPCPMCKKGFKKQQILDRHIKSFHTNDETLVCDVCGIRFRSEATLSVHKAIHTSRKFKCNFCDKEFLRESLRQIHESEKHTGEKPLKCKFCDESFTRKGRLAAHQLIHYGREIKCDYCDMLFAKVDTKMKHMKKHTNQRPFVCNVCSKAFKEKFNLEIHMRTHSSQKKFSCSKCRKRFSDMESLHSHLRFHDNEAIGTSYECDICSKLFSSAEELVTHTGTHTDQTQGETDLHDARQDDLTDDSFVSITSVPQLMKTTMPGNAFDLGRLEPISVDVLSNPPPAPLPEQQSIHITHDHDFTHDLNRQQHLELTSQPDVTTIPRQQMDLSNQVLLSSSSTHMDTDMIRRQPLPGNQIILTPESLPRRDDIITIESEHRQSQESQYKFEIHLLETLQRPQTISIEPFQRAQTLGQETLIMPRAGAPIIMDNLQNLQRPPALTMDNIQRPQNFLVDNLQRPQFTLMDSMSRPQLWNMNP